MFSNTVTIVSLPKLRTHHVGENSNATTLRNGDNNSATAAVVGGFVVAAVAVIDACLLL